MIILLLLDQAETSGGDGAKQAEWREAEEEGGGAGLGRRVGGGEQLELEQLEGGHPQPWETVHRVAGRKLVGNRLSGSRGETQIRAF